MHKWSATLFVNVNLDIAQGIAKRNACDSSWHEKSPARCLEAFDGFQE